MDSGAPDTEDIELEEQEQANGCSAAHQLPDGRSSVHRWTTEEHARLAELVDQFGGMPNSWALIARHLPGRTGKQARQRWINHTKPDEHRQGWTQDEELQLARLHAQHGPTWSAISRLMKGRTENSIKNHWNALLRSKRLDTKVDSLLPVYVRLIRDGAKHGTTTLNKAQLMVQQHLEDQQHAVGEGEAASSPSVRIKAGAAAASSSTPPGSSRSKATGRAARGSGGAKASQAATAAWASHSHAGAGAPPHSTLGPATLPAARGDLPASTTAAAAGSTPAVGAAASLDGVAVQLGDIKALATALWRPQVPHLQPLGAPARPQRRQLHECSASPAHAAAAATGEEMGAYAGTPGAGLSEQLQQLQLLPPARLPVQHAAGVAPPLVSFTEQKLAAMAAGGDSRAARPSVMSVSAAGTEDVAAAASAAAAAMLAVPAAQGGDTASSGGSGGAFAASGPPPWPDSTTTSMPRSDPALQAQVNAICAMFEQCQPTAATSQATAHSTGAPPNPASFDLSTADAMAILRSPHPLCQQQPRPASCGGTSPTPTTAGCKFGQPALGPGAHLSASAPLVPLGEVGATAPPLAGGDDELHAALRQMMQCNSFGSSEPSLVSLDAPLAGMPLKAGAGSEAAPPRPDDDARQALAGLPTPSAGLLSPSASEARAGIAALQRLAHLPAGTAMLMMANSPFLQGGGAAVDPQPSPGALSADRDAGGSGRRGAAAGHGRKREAEEAEGARLPAAAASRVAPGTSGMMPPCAVSRFTSAPQLHFHDRRSTGGGAPAPEPQLQVSTAADVGAFAPSDDVAADAPAAPRSRSLIMQRRTGTAGGWPPPRLEEQERLHMLGSTKPLEMWLAQELESLDSCAWQGGEVAHGGATEAPGGAGRWGQPAAGGQGVAGQAGMLGALSVPQLGQPMAQQAFQLGAGGGVGGAHRLSHSSSLHSQQVHAMQQQRLPQQTSQGWEPDPSPLLRSLLQARSSAANASAGSSSPMAAGLPASSPAALLDAVLMEGQPAPAPGTAHSHASSTAAAGPALASTGSGSAAGPLVSGAVAPSAAATPGTTTPTRALSQLSPPVPQQFAAAGFGGHGSAAALQQPPSYQASRLGRSGAGSGSAGLLQLQFQPQQAGDDEAGEEPWWGESGTGGGGPLAAMDGSDGALRQQLTSRSAVALGAAASNGRLVQSISEGFGGDGGGGGTYDAGDTEMLQASAQEQQHVQQLAGMLLAGVQRHTSLPGGPGVSGSGLVRPNSGSMSQLGFKRSYVHLEEDSGEFDSSASVTSKRSFSMERAPTARDLAWRPATSNGATALRLSALGAPVSQSAFCSPSRPSQAAGDEARAAAAMATLSSGPLDQLAGTTASTGALQRAAAAAGLLQCPATTMDQRYWSATGSASICEESDSPEVPCWVLSSSSTGPLAAAVTAARPRQHGAASGGPGGSGATRDSSGTPQTPLGTPPPQSTPTAARDSLAAFAPAGGGEFLAMHTDCAPPDSAVVADGDGVMPDGLLESGPGWHGPVDGAGLRAGGAVAAAAAAPAETMMACDGSEQDGASSNQRCSNPLGACVLGGAGVFPPGTVQILDIDSMWNVEEDGKMMAGEGTALQAPAPAWDMAQAWKQQQHGVAGDLAAGALAQLGLSELQPLLGAGPDGPGAGPALVVDVPREAVDLVMQFEDEPWQGGGSSGGGRHGRFAVGTSNPRAMVAAWHDAPALAMARAHQATEQPSLSQPQYPQHSHPLQEPQQHPWTWGALPVPRPLDQVQGLVLDGGAAPALWATATPEGPAAASGSIVPPLVSAQRHQNAHQQALVVVGGDLGEAGPALAAGGDEDDEAILCSLLHELCQQ